MTVVINSGQLKHPITINEQHFESDGAGGKKSNWVGFGIDRARILPISASERIKSDAKEMITTHLVEIRYRPGMHKNMQIITRDRKLQIISIINPEEADVKLQLLCQEIS